MPATLMDNRMQQALAIGMPVVAVALSLLIVYPTWGRYTDLKAEVEAERAKLEALRSAPLPPPESRMPAADDVESEPSLFIGEITALARASGCEVRGLEVASASAEKSDALRPVGTKVTLLGHYPRIRAFLLNLRQARRLYTVTDLSLQAGSGSQEELASRRLNATLTIERYVTPPAPQPDAESGGA